MSSIGRISLDLGINKKGFTKQVNGIGQDVKKSFNSMSVAVGNILSNLATQAVKSISGFVKDSIDKGSELAELQNVVDTVFTTMSDKVEEFSKSALNVFGLTESQAKKMVGTYGAMSKSFGYTEKQAYNMSTALVGLTADVASFYNLSYDESYTKMKSVFTGETESLKELGVVMTQTALDTFAMEKGFGKTTSAMSEQEKVALRLAFVQDKLSAASGDFEKTSKSWANQTRILAGQFDSLKAAIGQGLINALTPVINVINAIMSKLVALANTFKNFMAALFGSGDSGTNPLSGLADAAGATEDALAGASDSAADTAGSAKQIKKSLMGFDEINKIQNKDSGGGGGSSDGGGTFDFGDFSPPSMGPVATESVDDFVNALKDAWSKSDFSGIGEIIGYKIRDALSSINWQGIKDTAYKIAKSIATFLNGIFNTPGLFTQIGTTIAEALNTAVSFALGYVENFDFSGYGKALSDGVMAFFETFDFAGAAQAISGWYRGVLQAAATFLKETDFTVVGEKIAEFLKNLDLTGIISDLATVIWEAIKAAFTLLGTLITEAPLETALIGAFALFKWSGLGSTIATSIGKAILSKIAGSALATTIATGLSGAFAALPTLLTGSISLFGAATAGEIALALSTGLLGALAAVFIGWNIGKWLYENTKVGDFADALVELIAKLCIKIGDFFIGIGETIANIWSNIKETVVNIATGLSEGLRIVWEGISGFFLTILEGIRGFFTSSWNGIKSVVTSVTNFLKNLITTVWNTIKTVITTIITTISTVVTTVFNTLKNTLTTIWENIKMVVTTVWEGIKGTVLGIVEGLKNGISTAIDAISEKVTGVFSTMRDTVKGIFEGMWNAIKFVINGILGGIETLANGVVRGINKVIDALNNMSFDVPNWVPGIGGETFGFDIGHLNEISLPRLAQGGYVKANQPQPVIVGDNKTQGEIISPEDKMFEVMLAALEQFFTKLMQAGYKPQSGDISGDIVIPIYLDGQMLEEIIINAQQRKNMRSGGR